MRLAIAAAAFLAAAPALAVELPNGAWVLGADAGLGVPLGQAKNAAGNASALGGQVFYHPYGDWGVGIQLDRLLFKSKAGNSLQDSLVTLVGRKNVNNDYENVLPYVIGGIGYSESHADLAAGGIDRGSGAALSAGLGLEYYVDPHLDGGLELRLMRAAAPLPRLGVGGTTAAVAVVRLNFALGPESDPFARR